MASSGIDSFWPSFGRSHSCLLYQSLTSQLVRTTTVATIVTGLEARTRFGMLLQRVAKGEEIVVTRFDKPVARIVPADDRDLRDVRQGVDSLLALRSQIAEWRGSGEGLDDGEVRSMIEDGRR